MTMPVLVPMARPVEPVKVPPAGEIVVGVTVPLPAQKLPVGYVSVAVGGAATVMVVVAGPAHEPAGGVYVTV